MLLKYSIIPQDYLRFCLAGSAKSESTKFFDLNRADFGAKETGGLTPGNNDKPKAAVSGKFKL